MIAIPEWFGKFVISCLPTNTQKTTIGTIMRDKVGTRFRASGPKNNRFLNKKVCKAIAETRNVSKGHTIVFKKSKQHSSLKIQYFQN